MNKVLKILDKLDFVVCGIITLALFIDIMLQVLSRVLPGNALPWTLELGEALLGALIWLGISAGVKQDSHVGFDLVTKRFHAEQRKYFGLFANLLFMAFLIILAYFTNMLLGYYMQYGSTATILPVSMVVIRAPIFIGCIASVIRLCIKQYNVFTGKEVMFADADYEAAIHMGEDEKEGK